MSRTTHHRSQRSNRRGGGARLRPYGQTWYGPTCRCCAPAAGKWWKSAERRRARSEAYRAAHEGVNLLTGGV